MPESENNKGFFGNIISSVRNFFGKIAGIFRRQPQSQRNATDNNREVTAETERDSIDTAKIKESEDLRRQYQQELKNSWTPPDKDKLSERLYGTADDMDPMFRPENSQGLKSMFRTARTNLPILYAFAKTDCTLDQVLAIDNPPEIQEKIDGCLREFADVVKNGPVEKMAEMMADCYKMCIAKEDQLPVCNFTDDKEIAKHGRKIDFVAVAIQDLVQADPSMDESDKQVVKDYKEAFGRHITPEEYSKAYNISASYRASYDLGMKNRLRFMETPAYSDYEAFNRLDDSTRTPLLVEQHTNTVFANKFQEQINNGTKMTQFIKEHDNYKEVIKEYGKIQAKEMMDLSDLKNPKLHELQASVRAEMYNTMRETKPAAQGEVHKKDVSVEMTGKNREPQPRQTGDSQKEPKPKTK